MFVVQLVPLPFPRTRPGSAASYLPGIDPGNSVSSVQYFFQVFHTVELLVQTSQLKTWKLLILDRDGQVIMVVG